MNWKMEQMPGRKNCSESKEVPGQPADPALGQVDTFQLIFCLYFTVSSRGYYHGTKFGNSLASGPSSVLLKDLLSTSGTGIQNGF